jgi:hypothetical protein
MKWYQVGLLVLGAGIAGGFALKMTQLPPVTLPPPPQPVINAPPPVAVVPQKPSPIPQTQRVRPSTPVQADAPQPVYDEPPKPAARRTPPVTPPAPVHSATNIKPRQWIPGRYDSFGDSASEPKAAAKPAPAPAPAPLVAPASIDKTTAAPVVPAIENEPAPAPHRATLRSGMAIPIRLDETLSSDHSPKGWTFVGTLIEPLVADGFVIAERGARVSGRVLDSEKAGRATGTSRLQIGLTDVSTSDGQQVAINTEPWVRLGDTIPAETVVRFRLTSMVTITERQLAAK